MCAVMLIAANTVISLPQLKTSYKVDRIEGIRREIEL